MPAHRIVCELEEAGYLSRAREGRRNVHRVHPDAHLTHELERGTAVRELLGVLRDDGSAADADSRAASAQARC